MKRVNIVVEGQTEETYVNEVLAKHLGQFEVYVSVRSVVTGRKGSIIYRGGVIDYPKLKKDVTIWLKQEREIIVTTMVDLYALPDDFPKRSEGRKIKNPYERVEFLEKAFFDDIGSPRFIPYIQLHEFEALLFVDISKLSSLYPDQKNEIENLEKEIVGLNPEEINEGERTAPSKRILKYVPYKKISAGPSIANYIGLPAIRHRCQHFNNWLTRLESLGQAR